MSLTYDLNKNYHQTYIRFRKNRDIGYIDQLLKENHVYSNINSKQKFIELYKNYELSRRYESETKERIYGVELKILLPQKDYSHSQLCSMARKFSKYVIQEEKGLKCVAFTRTKNKLKWLHVFFIDREYIDTHKVRYLKDIYRNSRTKGFCSKDHPLAELVAAKGSIKKDADGNPLVNESGFKARKTRKFIYSDKDFENFIDRFKAFFTQSLAVVREKLVRGLTINRINLKKAFNRFERRVILANNTLIQSIQNELNILLQKTVRDVDWRDVMGGEDPGGYVIDKKLYLLVKKTFGEYRQIFKTGQFFDEDSEQLHKIQKTRADTAELNLKKLKYKFEKDLKELKILF